MFPFSPISESPEKLRPALPGARVSAAKPLLGLSFRVWSSGLRV